MLQEIARHPRARSIMEIGRRADNERAYRRDDGDCHHIGRNHLRETHPGIEAFADDIYQRVVGDNVDFDIRIAPAIFEDKRHQKHACRTGRHVEAQRARYRTRRHAGIFDRPVDRRQCRRHLRHETLAGIRQGDAARRPVENPHGHALFQRGDRMAERGRRHAKLTRGRAKTAVARDGGDGFKLRKACLHCAIFLISLSMFVLLDRTDSASYLSREDKGDM